MERTRNVPIALKTTPEMKDKLNLVTERMSSQAGCMMTQTQAVERLISDALRMKPTEEEVIERAGFIANHAMVMNRQAGHSARLQMQTQLNANRLADLLKSDICIRDMSDAITIEDDDGHYMSAACGTDGKQMDLDMDGSRMFETLHFLLGGKERYCFKDPNTAMYYEELVSLLNSYTDASTVCDNGFSIIAADNILFGMGYAPYLSNRMRDKGVTDKDIQMFQSVLDTLLHLAVEHKALGCEYDDYAIRVLKPKDSIFMPDVGDGTVYALTVLFLPYDDAKRFPLL